MRQLGCRERGHNGAMLLTDARVVTPDEVLDPGWVAVHGDRIAGVGAGDAPDNGEHVALGGRHLVPGFVDLHVHGGGGHAMQSADAVEIRRAVAFHRSRGTTNLVVSVMSAPLDAMLTVVGGRPDGADSTLNIR